jgi:hypothetical protein
MRLTDIEVKCIEILARMFAEGRVDVSRIELQKIMQLSEVQMNSLLRMMHEFGAIERVMSGTLENEFALDFSPAPRAVELARGFEDQRQQKNIPPDIVDQIMRRFRTNPRTAIIIFIILALSLILSLLNQGCELIDRIINWFR